MGAIMLPWVKLIPYAAAAAAVVALAAWIAAWTHEAGVTQRKREAGELLERITDKAQVWSEVVNGRAQLDAWMTRFDRIMDASDEERAAFRADLTASHAQVRAARDQASAMLKELDDARSKAAVAWKNSRIPADINCGVLHSPGCPVLPAAAAGAAGEAAGRVPGPAAAPGGDGPAVGLPAGNGEHGQGNGGSPK
jgi:hypothetical protein